MLIGIVVGYMCALLLSAFGLDIMFVNVMHSIFPSVAITTDHYYALFIVFGIFFAKENGNYKK